MDIEEELKLAVATRNAKRKSGTVEVHKFVNKFLGNTLARAIAQDEPLVSVVFKRENVSSPFWEELSSYIVADCMTTPHKFIMEDYVDKVYKSYLVGAKVTSYPEHILVTFYLNQD